MSRSVESEVVTSVRSTTMHAKLPQSFNRVETVSISFLQANCNNSRFLTEYVGLNFVHF